MPTSGKTIYETGAEPEFIIDQIVRVEPMRGGMVRIFVGGERGNMVRVEYSVVVLVERLAEIGRACLTIAAETHNAEIWSPAETAH